MRVRAPLEITAIQRRLNISADPSYKLNQDQGTLSFEWDIIPPFTTKFVTVRSQVGLWKEPVKAGGTDLKRYLLAEPTIEADHPEIKALAGQLKGNSTQESIRKIFDHVSEKIVHIGYVKRTRGALYALKYGKGDCTEYAHLFVALCRANGIPARVVGGFVCPNSSTLDLGDFHNWAEFYHKGRWQIADPQMRKLMTDQNHYIAFQIVDPSRSDEGPVIADANPKELKVSLNH